MGEATKIEWTATRLRDGTLIPGHTFNPWRGCQAVSEGCDHCYAKTLVERYGGNFAVRQRTSATYWRQPYKWQKQAEIEGYRPKVFCASLADVFDNQVEPQWRADLWSVIWRTPTLDWLLLTKRPQNIIKMLPTNWGKGWNNVWIGCTAENQAEADRRIPLLLEVPAAVRFLSCEPLLGPVSLRQWMCLIQPDGGPAWCDKGGLHWVIVGGESGPGKRPMDLAWARSLRDQCNASGVAFFGKQDDEVRPLPDDLMVRQWPQVKTLW